MTRNADASKPRAAVRHGRLRKSNPFVTVAKIVAATAAVVGVSGIAVAGVAALDLANSVKPVAHLDNETPGAPPPNIGAIEGGVNLLLVGSDSGDGNAAYGDREENLNDVTILMHISADHSSATVVSFPRDMYVQIGDCADGGNGRDKMNTALMYGGADGGLACAVSTVEGITGLSIPFAAQIGFDGVISMSNAVGGVPVCVTEPSTTPGAASTSTSAPTTSRARPPSPSSAHVTASATAATSRGSRTSRCSSPRSSAR